LQADMAASFRQAFPEARVVVDAPLQMRRNLADLRHAAGQPDSSDFLPLLAKVAPIISGVAQIQSMQYEHGMLKLELRLHSGSLADLRPRLLSTGLNAEFDNSAVKTGAVVKLMLSEGRI
jgi:general secretion pathway protein L